MKWLFATLFIFIGVFLLFLTIDDIGWGGYAVKIIIGGGCFFIAGIIVNGMKQKN